MQRTLRHGFVALVLVWVLGQGLREPWRAMWFHLADPWPAAAPVLWTPSSVHVERLRADLERLPLDDLGTLAAVTDTDLGDQAWYQYLWLAYLLPRHDVVWTPGGEAVAGADGRLVLGPHAISFEAADP